MTTCRQPPLTSNELRILDACVARARTYRSRPIDLLSMKANPEAQRVWVDEAMRDQILGEHRLGCVWRELCTRRLADFDLTVGPPVGAVYDRQQVEDDREEAHDRMGRAMTARSEQS